MDFGYNGMPVYVLLLGNHSNINSYSRHLWHSLGDTVTYISKIVD